MSIYTVDDNGQIFVTPEELDEFEYYRDNVFVRTYEEFLTLNPHEITTIDWVDRLGPEYWTVEDPTEVEWDGSKWVALKNCTFKLEVNGSWATDFRVPFIRITASDTETFIVQGTSHVLITTSSGFTHGNRCCFNQYYYNEDIISIDIGWVFAFPFNVTQIEFGYWTVLQINIIEPVTSYITNTGSQWRPRATDLDSNQKIHALVSSSSNNIYYWTNKSDSWVETNLSILGADDGLFMILDSNDDIHIIYGSGGNLNYIYYDGSWSSPSIITAASFFSGYLDVWIDDVDTIHVIYKDTYIYYWYKTTSGSWTNDNPPNFSTSSGYFCMCARNSKEYILYSYLSGTNETKMIVRDGSWGTPSDAITAFSTYIVRNLFIDSNEDLWSVTFQGTYIYILKNTGSWSVIETIPLPDEIAGISALYANLQSDGILNVFINTQPCDETAVAILLMKYENGTYNFSLCKNFNNLKHPNRIIRDQSIIAVDVLEHGIDDIDFWESS